MTDDVKCSDLTVTVQENLLLKLNYSSDVIAILFYLQLTGVCESIWHVSRYTHTHTQPGRVGGVRG